jgi:hypothetical protein
MPKFKQGPLCPKCGLRRMVRGAATAGGRLRWVCRENVPPRRTCYSTTNPDAPYRDRAGAPITDPVFKRKLPEGAKRFIITSAQNATPIHRNFFASLLRAARHLDAQLLVVPFRYKNPTSVFSKDQQDLEWWDKKVVKYLWNQRLDINDNLTLLAEIKVQPTASDPLRGFEAITHGESSILAHTKLALKVVASPSNKFPKVLTTTGAVTKPNYTDSRAGALGEFHHALAAVIVEVVDKKRFHLRHLNANKNGEFTDLNLRFTPAGKRRADRPLALVMGDTHTDFIDPVVERATFGADGIIDVLKPKALIWHDVLDAYSVNPHHNRNPFIREAKQRAGLNDVRKEIERCVAFVCARTVGDMESYIVTSNHNEFVTRYMSDIDWKEDLTNARFYFETGAYILEHSRIGPQGFEAPSPFEYWFTKFSDSKAVKVLRGSSSLVRGGIELAMHGDIGPSGAKGSTRNLRRVGIRSVIGHSHSPAIDEGCYQVGTSTMLRLEYTHGPGAWLNTHCVVHADGKRQLITIIDGEWRL